MKCMFAETMHVYACVYVSRNKAYSQGQFCNGMLVCVCISKIYAHCNGFEATAMASRLCMHVLLYVIL
jgi:hypothetical protein